MQWQNRDPYVKQAYSWQESYWGLLIDSSAYKCYWTRVLIVYLNGYQVFPKEIDVDTVVLMAARASRVENQDSIDSTIVGMLADPKEVADLVMFHMLII